ncbi:MAG: saccharopine dehydrogenase NADP-binding domain-containing protein [Candidatus Peribacteraceae bacterium]|nr:saccharopine dehydrogenase NADP-binding domain-containing protein [Candidatus Peribacteraceae bacterium]MDD5075273.1 saccharopine dehydrogenase NADP-binding domain-containing protein [Candidatus Peribacteraceae bacterium]
MIHSKIPFRGNILVLGFGSVAKCTLPLLLRHLDVSPKQITVVDMADVRVFLTDLLKQGLTFRQEKLEEASLGRQLAALVKRGDLIVDLAWNIGCIDLLTWCHENGVLYVNTSVELWDPYKEDPDPCARTLYVRHMAIRELIRSWKDKPGPTAVIEHGANPGLVSHFTKVALLDIGERLCNEKPGDLRRNAIDHAMRYENFAELASLLNVQTIHISEIDTQVTNTPHDPNTFLNTWSVEGFHEEGVAPAEMGWGTHERTMPKNGHAHTSGPRNQICLDSFSINTFVKSRVPSQEIVGMVIRHGEAFTLSDALTLWNRDGTASYRPTVHYAYCPCVEALRALEDLRNNNYVMQEKWRVMQDEITGGADELGVLLMGHDYTAWWMGSVLDIQEARALVPGQNATTLQVAVSVLAAVCWIIRNPEEGVNIPDQLPHRDILKVAAPYLGKLPSVPIDWTPTGKKADADTWQFANFLTEEKPHGKVFKP